MSSFTSSRKPRHITVALVIRHDEWTSCSVQVSQARDTQLTRDKVGTGGQRLRQTHVVFRRIAPLLHVHDFHVQHGPKLHLDPAKAEHKIVRRAAVLYHGRETAAFIAGSFHQSALHLDISSDHSPPPHPSSWRNGHQSDQRRYR